MLRDSNNGAIGNWFCPACHAENDYFQNRCTSCNKGEKDERCTIQSPKLRSSSNLKNSWASQAKGGGANNNASSPLPSSNSKPNLAASAASPSNTSRGGLSRSGGFKNDKGSQNEPASQPQKTPSNKNVPIRYEETVEIKRTLGDLSKSVSKNKLDPSKNVVAHYCKWDWLYCSGDCDTSDLYYSKINLFHDLVDEEPVRAVVVVVAAVVYNDAWLEHVTVGLRAMGLLSEPMEKTDEQGSTAPTKSEKREKKKEYSQSKIDALRNRMEQNESISKNLQAMTPSKKKTNSKAQKVKISIYGGNDYDDFDDEEEDYDEEETPESGDEYETTEGDDSQGSEDWVKKQSRLTEEEQIARILQQEILEQQRLRPQPTRPTDSQAKPAPIRADPVPLTFAQMQQQKTKLQQNPKQHQQQQKQPYIPPPKVTPVPTPQPKPQNTANQQQPTQNGQKKQNQAQQPNKNNNGTANKDQPRPGIQKNQNQNMKQQKLKI